MRFPLLVTAIVLAQAGLSAQDLASAAPNPEVERLFGQGERAYRAGAYAEAIGYYDQVLQRDPDHINAYLQRGFCHSIQKDYAGAASDFSAVIDRKNDHMWAYTSRGSAYAKLGRHDLAMRDFDHALELDPKNEEAYNNRGWSKKATGDQSGACKDWKTSRQMGNAEARIILTNNRCK